MKDLETLFLSEAKASGQEFSPPSFSPKPELNNILLNFQNAWVSLAAKNRVIMIQISRQLGHSSIRITEEHYAQNHPDYMGEARNHAGRMLQNFL
ncbi:hypothetical protein N9E91_00810 [Alphaproteobacteria bacterium]|nr:hypothetical protein [Alphaproteobacteria bacterium]